MKKYLVFFLIIGLLSGCETEKVGGDRDEHDCIGSAGYTWCEPKQKCLRSWEEECENNELSEGECITSSDCVIGGCSGTICQSKNREPVYTTCEYMPEYACYKQINCGCISGKCQWDKSAGFDRCVLEKKKSREVIV